MTALFLLIPLIFAGVTPPRETSALEALKAAFQAKGPPVRQKIERTGDQTVRVEALLEIDGDVATFQKLAAKPEEWRNWAFEEFNVHAENEPDYFVAVHDAVQKAPGELTALYSFNLPFFAKHRARTFTVRSTGFSGGMTLEGEAITNPHSTVKNAKVVAHVFPSPKPHILWIWVEGSVQFRSWLLYQALPERVLLREVGDRLEKLAKNFEKESVRLKRGTPSQTRPPVVNWPSDS